MREIYLPLINRDIDTLRAGDRVLLTGSILTARDAAHKRLFTRIQNNDPLPFETKGEVIYYVGPAPAKPGRAVGPAGPTSSYRMDPYTPALLDRGLKGMIGKGMRSRTVIESIQKNHAVYFVAIGGAAALLSRCIIASTPVCYDDLGTEAVCRFEIVKFPVIVAVDCLGNNLYDSIKEL